MNKSNAKEVKQAVIYILEQAGVSTENLIKLAIILDGFYKDTEPFLKKVSLADQISLMNKFMLFTIQFEMICARSFKPSGTQSVASTIQDIYHEKQRAQIRTTPIEEILNEGLMQFYMKADNKIIEQSLTDDLPNRENYEKSKARTLNLISSKIKKEQQHQ